MINLKITIKLDIKIRFGGVNVGLGAILSFGKSVSFLSFHLLKHMTLRFYHVSYF